MFTSAQALKSLAGGDSMDISAWVVQLLGCGDGVDRSARDLFIFSIFCTKKLPKSLASWSGFPWGNDAVFGSLSKVFVTLNSFL